jgi:FkbM family methyltransferase
MKTLVGKNKYGKYCVPDFMKRRPVVAKILRGEVWEPDTIAFMMNNCGGGDVVTAGTYFGDFLPALSKAMDPNTTVWAFEPSLESYQCACKTLKLNSIINVCLRNAGLGDRRFDAKIRRRYGKGVEGCARILEEKDDGLLEEGLETDDVSVVRIDDALPPDRHISMIQLDVEFYEKQALGGALETIRRCKPILIIEDTLDFLKSPWFAETILSLGYMEGRRLHGNVVFRAKP